MSMKPPLGNDHMEPLPDWLVAPILQAGHQSSRFERLAKEQASLQSRAVRSLSGLSWTEVVQEQAAANVALEKELRLADGAVLRKECEIGLLKLELADARKTAEDAGARVAELEAMKSKANKRARGLRQKFNQAVRVITGQGRVEKRLRRTLAAAEKFAEVAVKADAEWRDVAVAEQEALRVLTLERDGLKETLRSTTADMNRYFADWKAAVGQIALLQEQWEAGKKNFNDKADRVEELRVQLDAVTAERDLLRSRELAQSEESWAIGELEMLKCKIAEAFDVDGKYLSAEDTIKSVASELEALRRDSLKAQIAELEAELVAVKRAAAKAAGVVSLEHAEAQNVLRANFNQEIQGLQVMLADAERKAWHGVLMTRALTFDLPPEEVARISEECWASMKAGVDGKVLSPGGAIVAAPQLTVDSGQLTAEEPPAAEEGANPPTADASRTEGAESTEEVGTIAPGESPGPKCASCGDEVSLSERHCITPKGSQYCEPCYDAHMEALAAKGGAV